MDPVEAIEEEVRDGRRIGVAIAQFSSPEAAKPNIWDECARDKAIFRRGVMEGLEIAKSILSGELTSLPHWAGIYSTR